MDEIIKKVGTEERNELSKNIDIMSIKDILLLMNDENNNVINAVKNAIPCINKVAEKAYEILYSGGRLIYMGAGTSGRLGVLDAPECPPTFGVSENMVIGLIAGGDEAFRNAIEGAEDDKEAAIKDLDKISFSNKDMLIGIAASGRTPYVIGGLEYAKNIGAYTAVIVNNQDTIMSKIADETIELLTGPEVVTGSTRLKAGTSQKITLNMISTSVMIKLGKVYENLMIDVKPTNEKLKARAEGIVMKVANVDNDKARVALERANWNPKLAITMLMTGKDIEVAQKLLNDSGGILRNAILKNEEKV